MKNFNINNIKLRPQVINLSPQCTKYNENKDDKRFENFLKVLQKKYTVEYEYPHTNIKTKTVSHEQKNNYNNDIIINRYNMPYYIDYTGDPFLRTSHYYLTKPKTFTKMNDRYTK